VWQPSEPLSLRVAYHFGWNRLDSPWPLTAEQERLAYGCPDPCRLSSFEQVLQWDRRDNPIEPRRGYTLGLTVREAGGPLGGAGGFIQLSPQVRGYVTPDAAGRWTLAGRLRFGLTAHAAEDPVPILFRFFSGGAQAMRGFGYRRLSPLLVVPRMEPGDPQGVTLPVGGDGLLEASVELRYRLSGRLTLATFVDLGAVTPGRLSLGPSSLADALQWAVGVGARYTTPLGPLRVDLAWRPPIGQELAISQLPGLQLSYPTGSGCFGIGKGGRTGSGSPEGACALHLTFGEAF
jgi:outer membrane protein assembly factor BamA